MDDSRYESQSVLPTRKVAYLASLDLLETALAKIVCQILEKAKIRVSSNQLNQRALPVQQIQATHVAAQEVGRCYDGLLGHASMEDILEVAIPGEWVGSSSLKTRDICESRRRSLHDSLHVDLPSTISEALKPHVGKEIREPPPMIVRLSKLKTPSSKKAALAEWLESSEGQLWRKERDTIFAG